MKIEEAIAILLAAGGTRGVTASEGSKDYERARGLDFVRCDCSYNDRSGPGYDFIAKTPRGAYLYVGIGSRDKTISCGPKGFHQLNGTTPCI